MLKWDSIWRVRPRGRDRSARRRDPLTVGVAFLVNIGWAGAISGLGATLVGSALIGAALFGVSAIVNAFAPKPAQSAEASRPDPTDRQSTVKQTVGARSRFYGRNKVGGTLWFFESRGGVLYSGITLNEGEISGIQEVWLNDQRVTLDGNGYVLDAPYGGGLVRVLFKMGTSSQAVHSVLDSVFTEVTPAHRLRGVANCLATFQEVAAERIGEVYPQGNPGVRVVADFSLVKSVRTGARSYSDNPADVIYDYLTGVDDAGFPYGAGLLEGQIDLASFQAFANLCDQLVAKKGGGFIKRYRLAGGFGLNEEMRSVMQRMCRTCDADLYTNGAGKMAIRGGKWTAPTLTLDSSLGHIISGEFQQGRGALAAFNELTITYTDPSQDYMRTEAERWLDNTNIALRGKVLSETLDLEMVPEHAQARRLAKIHTHKSNPEWIGTIVTNFYGLNALGEETVTIRFGPLGIDTSFAVQSVKILDDLSGVQLSVASLGQVAYAWDAALEEGTAPGVAPDTSSPVSLDPPSGISASTEQIVIDGSTVGVRILVGWTPPARAALSQQVELRLGSGGSWQPMTRASDGGYAYSGVVSDGSTYEYRVRTISVGGVPGEWSAIGSITVVSDATPPGIALDVVAEGGDGEIVFNWTAPNSPNYTASRLYWNNTNSFGTATLAALVYGAPNSPNSRTVGGVSAGTRYGWVVAINYSGVASAPVATGPIDVI